MADQVQWRGGTTDEHENFTGAIREVTVDTTKTTLVVHDGATAGGVPLLREDLDNLGDASIAAAKLATNVLDPYLFFKADAFTPAFEKTDADTISVKAGTSVMVGSTLVSFPSETAVTMPSSLSQGTDYGIYCCSDGSLIANEYGTYPNDYDSTTARMIGGFHYSLVDNDADLDDTDQAFNTDDDDYGSMIWTQDDIDALAGINKFTIWDLKYRPKCDDPRGMTCVNGAFWADIYFCSADHITNGTSAYNTDIASETVPPIVPTMFGGDGSTTYDDSFNWYETVEVATSHNKRLPSINEFIAAAYGVTEGQSLGGSSVVVSATGREPGYTSRWGLEQATGHQWAFGNPVGVDASSTNLQTLTERGSVQYPPFSMLLGGSRASTTSSGSRCSWSSYNISRSSFGMSLRCFCDHLMLL